MQVLESNTESSRAPAILIESPSAGREAVRMRALRRKARRISAYARFHVEALNTLAVEVEADLAALRH